MKKLYEFSKAALLIIVILAVGFTGLKAQDRSVQGKVVSEGEVIGIPGVSVSVKGTTMGTITDAEGNYRLSVPASNGGVLVFSFVGFVSREVPIGSQSTVDASLTPDVKALAEVVVTGYSSERKKDIIGSVAVVNTKELLATPAANLTAQLQGRAAGVSVSSSGEPGAAARVRIRGFASFGNNDPLYIIDGVPTEDPSKLNPQDIESMQVLKDATSASIYGSRAANGVIIITTRQGKGGKSQISYDGYYGIQTIPGSTIPNMLNTQQYTQYLSRTSTAIHNVFGDPASPTVPAFIVSAANFKGGVAADDPRANPDLYTIADYGAPYQILRTSPGTDWFKEVTRSGIIQSHQISASGGTDKGTYSVGFNYFNQQGTFKYTGYDRYTARVNTVFNPKRFIRIGENIQLSYENRQGRDNKGEEGAWAQSYRMVPYIPVYDIKGGWGGNGVGQSGNGSNPVANLYRLKDNVDNRYKIFGNVFGEVDILEGLTLRTSVGIDYGNFFGRVAGLRTYERSENVSVDQLNEQSDFDLTWTWTNTLTFQRTFAENHAVKVLLGTEAIKANGRGISAFTQSFDFTTPDFLSLNTGTTSTPRVFNYETYRNTLASLFGRADYAFKGKYLFNATLRRDGSSKFGADNRYATFPAFGVGWRITGESFMDNVPLISDLKLRAGWGQLGSQKNVDPANQYYTFGSVKGTSNYDIEGNNTSNTTGYRASREGNTSTKWETTETTNIGIDAGLFNGKVDLSFNWFQNDTKDLLVEKVRNGLEPLVTKPKVNIGTMRNRGIDLMITNRGEIAGGLRYDASLTFTQYTNKVLKVDNSGKTTFDKGLDRLSTAIRTQAGHPISSFFGYQIDGFYQNEPELATVSQNGSVVGSWRYKDLNGDQVINDLDRTFLGSPIPDFQAGLNFSLAWKDFDFTTFLFWNYGNQIYNYTKYYTDMRVFVGGVSERVLSDSWTPQNPNAKLPRLGIGAENGFTSFTTSTSNSYYVESGSYFRAKTVQLGYRLPKALLSKIRLENVRLYVQGQNLFTITQYSGPDPDLSIQSTDNEDFTLGVDKSGFPNPRQFIFGLNVTL